MPVRVSSQQMSASPNGPPQVCRARCISRRSTGANWPTPKASLVGKGQLKARLTSAPVIQNQGTLRSAGSPPPRPEQWGNVSDGLCHRTTSSLMARVYSIFRRYTQCRIRIWWHPIIVTIFIATATGCSPHSSPSRRPSLIATLKSDEHRNAQVNAVTFNNEGSALAVVYSPDSSSDRSTIALWDMKSRKVTRTTKTRSKDGDIPGELRNTLKGIEDDIDDTLPDDDFDWTGFTSWVGGDAGIGTAIGTAAGMPFAGVGAIPGADRRCGRWRDRSRWWRRGRRRQVGHRPDR